VIDARADVFSVGCIMWAGVTGQKLWKDLTDIQVVKKVLGGEIPNPRTVNPECTEELARITMKALAIEADQRYPTARVLQLELEKYVEQQGLHIKRREVGEFISKLFGDIRAELSVHIESQLSELANSDTITPSGYELIQQELRRVSMAPRTEFTGTGTQTSAAGQGGLPKALIGVAIGLAAGVGALGFMVLNRDSAATAGTSSAPTVYIPAPAPTPVAPTVAKANLRLKVEPADAQLELEGRALPIGIASVAVEIRKEPYKLKVTAAGFMPEERDLQVDGDMELAISLQSMTPAVQPDPAGASPSPRIRWTPPRPAPGPAPGVAPAPIPEPPPAPKGPDCTNLFYYDAAGIKKVRPECL
jgi:serine/threonine-protein kinase